MSDSSVPTISAPEVSSGAFDTTAKRVPLREASPESLRELHDAGFDLTDLVARGGFGVVYRARDRRLQRDVAIKLIDRLATYRLGTPQPLQEIASLAALRHPHVVPLYESGALRDGMVYLVMPWIEGISLRARLTRDRRIPIAEALRLGIDLADALAAFHARGLVHRDVKPENVLMDGDHAMLIDLGLVCAVRSAAEPGTEPEPLIGTPNYMSPEQWTLGAGIDGRADVYGLGCLLYELLTGSARHESNPMRSRAQSPYRWSDSAHASDLIGETSGIPSGTVPRLRALRPEAPAALERLLQRALARDLNERLPAAARFKQELEAIQADGRNAPQQRRTRRTVLAAAVAIGVAVPPLVTAGVRYSTAQQLRALDPNRLVLVPVRNETGDRRFDSLALTLQAQMNAALAASKLVGEPSDSGLTVVAADDSTAAVRPGNAPIESVRKLAIVGRAATVITTHVVREAGRIVVRAAIIDARQGNERALVPALPLSPAATPDEVRRVTETLASTVVTSLRSASFQGSQDPH